ncbi:MAG: hypothetical protein ACXVCY_16880 [Pseudobdellovibrionaceae bacterium]
MRKKISLILVMILAAGFISIFLNRQKNQSVALSPSRLSQRGNSILGVEITKTQDEGGGEGQSILKLSNGRQISDLGYAVELIKQEVISLNRHIFILKSNPCVECDIPAELLIYFVEPQKKYSVILPGNFTNIDSEKIDDIAVGFVGRCGASDFKVWIFHKWLDGNSQERWNSEKIVISFTSDNIVEEKSNIDLSNFELNLTEFAKAQNCEKIPEFDQAYL